MVIRMSNFLSSPFVFSIETHELSRSNTLLKTEPSNLPYIQNLDDAHTMAGWGFANLQVTKMITRIRVSYCIPHTCLDSQTLTSSLERLIIIVIGII